MTLLTSSYQKLHKSNHLSVGSIVTKLTSLSLLAIILEIFESLIFSGDDFLKILVPVLIEQFVSSSLTGLDFQISVLELKWVSGLSLFEVRDLQ